MVRSLRFPVPGMPSSRAVTLVTGGAGFIGSHLVERLLALGHRVRVVDNLSTGNLNNLRHCRSDVEFIEGDLRDLATCYRACKGVETVFHQAALPSVPRSIADTFGTKTSAAGRCKASSWCFTSPRCRASHARSRIPGLHTIAM